MITNLVLRYQEREDSPKLSFSEKIRIECSTFLEVEGLLSVRRVYSLPLS